MMAGGACGNTSASLPLVCELPSALQPEEALAAWSDLPHVAFLDSALAHTELGRYSYLAADPISWRQGPPADPQPLCELATQMHVWRQPPADDLPPFTGGAVLLLSYDLNQALDAIRPTGYDEFQLPGVAYGVYDVVLVFDHLQQRRWLISQGLPETEEGAARRRAQERLAQFHNWLQRPPRRAQSPNVRQAAPLQTPQFATWGPAELTSSFSKPDYLQAVAQAVEYIAAGDIFQVNLAQTLSHPARSTSLELYSRLRRANPAPFAAYFDLGDTQILSASPERFLRVRGRHVEARPIKGTRPRRDWPEADLFAAADLHSSAKDRAENVMIVDLMRNDLARVCHPDSVQVTQLCQLEHYAFVQHLVSAVVGELRRDCGLEQLVRATFPGGSVTGAPKIRAMQIINELERNARGAYCGSLGYWSLAGELDLNILIRTITAAGGWWQLPVGGGIVADSDPMREYEETWHKATGMLRPILDGPCPPVGEPMAFPP